MESPSEKELYSFSLTYTFSLPERIKKYLFPKKLSLLSFLSISLTLILKGSVLLSAVESIKLSLGR